MFRVWNPQHSQWTNFSQDHVAAASGIYPHHQHTAHTRTPFSLLQWLPASLALDRACVRAKTTCAFSGKLVHVLTPCLVRTGSCPRTKAHQPRPRHSPSPPSTQLAGERLLVAAPTVVLTAGSIVQRRHHVVSRVYISYPGRMPDGRWWHRKNHAGDS